MLFRCLFFWRNLLCKETPQMFTLNEMSWIDLMSRSWRCPVCDCDKYFCNCWAFHGDTCQHSYSCSSSTVNNTRSTHLQYSYSCSTANNIMQTLQWTFCSILLDLIHKRYSTANNILQTFVLANPAIFLDNKTTLEFHANLSQELTNVCTFCWKVQSSNEHFVLAEF